tara:strand:+ start:556 stop:825 length:270 start_codon:yes stop_codon:yes gene_type:complete
MEDKMNIGDEVMYFAEYGDMRQGVLTAVGSDKDSYDDIKLKDGIFLYKSKKLKKYVPFKEKSLGSVYLEITLGPENFDYILPNEVIGSV